MSGQQTNGLVLCLFRFLSVANKPAVVLFSRHCSFFPHKKQKLSQHSACNTAMTLHVHWTVWKLKLNPTVFREFLTVHSSQYCRYQTYNQGFFFFRWKCKTGEPSIVTLLPWLRNCCSQHYSQMEKVGAKWNLLKPRF